MRSPIIGVTCNPSGSSNATYGQSNVTAATNYFGTPINPFGQAYQDKAQAPSSGTSTYFARQVQSTKCANGIVAVPPLFGTPTVALNRGLQSGPGSTTCPTAPDGTVTPTLMTLTDVANGVWDAVFHTSAQNIASVRPDAYIRPAWEWPGKDWERWTGPANAEAVKEWYMRYVTIARSHSDKFRFCWEGGREWSTSAMDTLDYFPGKQYVDVITGDYYDDEGLGGRNGWNTGGAVKAQRFLDFCRTNGLMFGIPEAGVVSAHGDDANWLEGLLDWGITNGDVVEFILYFNEQGSSLDNGNNPLTAAKLLERSRPLSAKALGLVPKSVINTGTGCAALH